MKRFFIIILSVITTLISLAFYVSADVGDDYAEAVAEVHREEYEQILYGMVYNSEFGIEGLIPLENPEEWPWESEPLFEYILDHTDAKWLTKKYIIDADERLLTDENLSLDSSIVDSKNFIYTHRGAKTYGIIGKDNGEWKLLEFPNLMIKYEPYFEYTLADMISKVAITHPNMNLEIDNVKLITASYHYYLYFMDNGEEFVADFPNMNSYSEEFIEDGTIAEPGTVYTKAEFVEIMKNDKSNDYFGLYTVENAEDIHAGDVIISANNKNNTTIILIVSAVIIVGVTAVILAIRKKKKS